MKTFKKETMDAILVDMRSVELNDDFIELAARLFEEIETGRKMIDMSNFKICERSVAAINFGTMKVIKGDTQTVKGFAMFDSFDVSGDRKEIALWIRRASSQKTAIVTLPNPFAAEEKYYNWAMKLMGDIIALVLTNREA